MSPVVPRFELFDEYSKSSAHVIRMVGELHVSTAPHLAQRISDVVYVDKTRIVLDMTDVEFVDSTGLSVMLNAQRLLTHIGGRLALVLTNPTVLRVFEVTKLDGTFAIFDGRESAIAYALADDEPAGTGESTSSDTPADDR